MAPQSRRDVHKLPFLPSYVLLLKTWTRIRPNLTWLNVVQEVFDGKSSTKQITLGVEASSNMISY